MYRDLQMLNHQLIYIFIPIFLVHFGVEINAWNKLFNIIEKFGSLKYSIFPIQALVALSAILNILTMSKLISYHV